MFILVVCGMAEAANGMQQLSVSFLLHYLGDLFRLSNHGKALIGTVSGAGMLVGATLWGRMSDTHGRKFAFTGSLLMSGLFGFLCAASPTFAVFLVLRFVLSIGIGGNVPLAFTIYTEFSPKHERGFYLTCLEAFWSFGAVVSCVAAWGILPTLGWEYYTLVCAAPSLILAFVVVFYMPETPRYHVVTRDIAAAQLTLESMAEQNGKPHLKQYQLGERPLDSPGEIQASFKDLFSQDYRRATIFLFFMYFLLSYGCGVFVWLPTLLRVKKLEVMSMYRSMVIMALSQVPGVITSAYVVEKFGRKPALALFYSMGGVWMCFFAVAQKESLIVMASIFMEFFLAGANGCLSAYTVEVYPTELRSTAMGACSSLSRFSSVINPTLWAVLLDLDHEAAIFVGAGALFMGFACVFMLSETKNVDLVDRMKKQD